MIDLQFKILIRNAISKAYNKGCTVLQDETDRTSQQIVDQLLEETLSIIIEYQKSKKIKDVD